MVLAGGAQKGSKSGPKRGISSNLPRARAEIHVIILLESAGDRGFSFRPHFCIKEDLKKFSVFDRFLTKNGPKMVQKVIYTSLLGVPLLDHFWDPFLDPFWRGPVQLSEDLRGFWTGVVKEGSKKGSQNDPF